ncbi:DUF3265 domain-containing protein [Vibrio vulnificus]|nr:DUF3265 domain-containing protein [Vibrio vulnificus]
MRAAWHFWYAVGFGGKCGLRKAGLGGTHPLTQRYVPNPVYVAWAVKFQIFYEIGCI